jgi:hypothetical protein
MTEREFVTAYVLARANGMAEGGFSGEGAARTACEVWKLLQRCEN